jgi:hypothetical protein
LLLLQRLLTPPPADAAAAAPANDDGAAATSSSAQRTSSAKQARDLGAQKQPPFCVPRTALSRTRSRALTLKPPHGQEAEGAISGWLSVCSASQASLKPRAPEAQNAAKRCDFTLARSLLVCTPRTASVARCGMRAPYMPRVPQRLKRAPHFARVRLRVCLFRCSRPETTHSFATLRRGRLVLSLDAAGTTEPPVEVDLSGCEVFAAPGAQAQLMHVCASA